MDDCQMYEIQYIFGSQILDNKMQYCVKWKNYPKTQKTWEPVENLGIHNMSSARRYQRHTDYTLFYKFVHQGKVNGYRIHQKQNLMEKIKVELESEEEEEIVNQEQANTDKVQDPQPELNSRSRASKASRKPIIEESDESEYGKKTKKSKQSNSRKRSPKIEKPKNQLIKSIKKEEHEEEQKLESPLPKQKVTPQKVVEQIKSTAYFNQLRTIINEFPDVNDFISEKQKDNPFELLGALYIYDKMKFIEEVTLGLEEQIKEVPLIKPPKKDTEEKKQIKKKKKQIQKDQSQRSTDVANKSQPEPKKTTAFKKVKLKRNTEEPPAMSDFLATLNQAPQLGLVHTEIDKNKEYGQIGFQKGEQILGHYYGINVCDVGKPEISLYFIMSFRRDGDKALLYNHVTKKQGLEYEIDLVYSYVNENKHLLPQLYNELFLNNVYNS